MAQDRRGLVPQRPNRVQDLERPFQLGDIVRLKRPDGPKHMIVVDAMPNRNVVVAYRMSINGKLVVREWEIHPDLLRRLKPPSWESWK